ncbi:MAG TPA: hypothetical protein VN805_11050 [Caulobacteraceae bacterium]|nr:hypothetical protein [Caulobacteraceae bacterium]
MAGPDSLGTLWQPDMIARFDDIDAETMIHVDFKKGEMAFLIKSQWQLFQSLNTLLQTVGTIAFTDEARTSLNNAYQSLQAAQASFATGSNALIGRVVETVGKR